jgi:3-dehydroquinate synthase
LSDHELRHGEAVAIGIELDARYSVEVGLLDAGDCARTVELLERLRLPTWDRRLDVRGPDGRRLVLDGIEEFREHLGGDLTVMMLSGIGCGLEVRELQEAAIEASIRWASDRAATSNSGSRSRRVAPEPIDAARG